MEYKNSAVAHKNILFSHGILTLVRHRILVCDELSIDTSISDEVIFLN
jgi:hypothetical protein